jgi:kumamolisin
MIPRPTAAAAWSFLAALAFLSPSAPAATAPGARLVTGSVRTPDPGGQTIGQARIVRALTADELAAPMPFSVSLVMRDFQGLQARLAAGEQISPAEMEARYLPLQSDFDRLSAWLRGQGFTPTLSDRLHMTVFVTGPVSRIAGALGVRFARVAVSDGEYTSAISEPAVPADLAPVVLCVNELQPQFRLRHVRVAPVQVPNDLVGGAVYVTPDNVSSAYNIPAGATGAGQIVAIVGEAAAPSSDFTSFWSETNVGQVASNVTTIDVNGGPSASPSSSLVLETDLDVEWVGAMAPGARIRLYLAQNAIETFTQISNDLPNFPTMTVISSSYGNTEGNQGSGFLQMFSQMTAAMAASGVSIMASSGDSGSNPNPTDGIGPGNYESTAPLAVSYPASDPNVTGVGGTTVNYTGSFSYAGELVWNQINDSTNPSASASGGGVSNVFAKPSWQTGGSVLAGQTMRCVPDIAAISDADFSNVNIGAQYQPVNGSDVGVLIYNGGGNPAGNEGASGTSLACPVWAGIAALINQARASNGMGPIGLLNPHLYALAGTNAFNDVTSGNNGAYSAGPGFDLCTGLGSPNVGNLINALGGGQTVGTGRLTNISTRALVGTGGNILIPGLYISGTGSETLLIRADGPALTQYGVAGVLAQPTLSVFNASGTLVASNTAWGTNSNPAQISSVSSQVGAFPLMAGSADCALIANLTAGAYTVQISGVNSTTGVALAEVYEVSATGTARLANISTRAMVGTGGNILIPGFYIQGSGAKELLVRADGPVLTQYGVGGVLTQPTLGVYNSSGTMVASNTGWGTGSDASQIPSVSASVGAFPLAAGSADCALIVYLQPGSYTIQVSGVGGTTGVALAEIYEVSSQ